MRICGVAGVMSAGADCAYTLSEKTEEMPLPEYLAFLEGTPEEPPALCMSARDWGRIRVAIQKACKKLGGACTREMQETIEQVATRVQRVQTPKGRL